MGRVTRSAKAVISGVVSALCCSDSLFLTISNVTEVTASSLRQLFLSLGGLWLNLTVFSLSLSSGFANTASYTHYVFQATTPVSIPSMPSEPPHSEDRISVSWQSPPVIYKGLPVRWLLLSFLFSSSQRRIRERLSPCLKVDSVSLVGSRLSLPACLSLSLGVFQKLHLHDFGFLSQMLLQSNESSFQTLVTGWQQRNCRHLVPVKKTQFIMNIYCDQGTAVIDQ